MDDRPSEGFRKLNFLLQQRPSPPETFVNLLLLYCKFAYYDLAADILAENQDLTAKYLTQVFFLSPDGFPSHSLSEFHHILFYVYVMIQFQSPPYVRVRVLLFNKG